MSHHIYKTEAVILGSKDSGESNRIFFLLTKELGFVIALSQGARNLKSKLRHHLQDMNLINAEMVKGKEVWRITSAEAVKNYSKTLLKDEHKLKSVARIFAVLRRLLHGESKNMALFDEAAKFLQFLNESDLDKNDILLLEILINLRILRHLGYGTSDQEINNLLSGNLSKELLHSLEAVRKKAVMEVNRALQESHL